MVESTLAGASFALSDAPSEDGVQMAESPKN
jgi:hypothetical protein